MKSHGFYQLTCSQPCVQFLVLKALKVMLLLFIQPLLLSHFLVHQKKWCQIKYANGVLTTGVLCCLALLLITNYIFLLYNCQTSFFTCSLKKAIREKNAVIAVRVSSFQFLKTASFFSFKDSPEGCKARTTTVGCLPLEIFALSSVKRMVLKTLLLVLCQYRSLNAHSNGVHYP